VAARQDPVLVLNVIQPVRLFARLIGDSQPFPDAACDTYAKSMTKSWHHSGKIRNLVF